MACGEHEDVCACIHIRVHMALDDMLKVLDELERILGDFCTAVGVLVGDKRLVLLDGACMTDILVGMVYIQDILADGHVADDTEVHVVEV